MQNLFNKPYPFNDDLKHNTKIIFFTSLGVFVFLWLFEPFDISILPAREKYQQAAGLAVITFLSLSLHLLLIPSLFPKTFSSEVWNIKKEIFWNLWILFTILAGYFLLNQSLGNMHLGFSLFMKLVLTAVIPISALIVINHYRMLRIHVKQVDTLNKKLQAKKSLEEQVVYFHSDYQKDSLAIKINALVYIRSANNYINVFWQEGDAVQHQMVRCGLAAAGEILKDYPFIIKCHRSYLVNVNLIDRIEGNSQGYRLFFNQVDQPIPISKNAIENLKKLL